MIRRSTSSVLALNGRARMIASARTSPMPSSAMRSSRLAELRSIWAAAAAGAGRVCATEDEASASAASTIRGMIRLIGRLSHDLVPGGTGALFEGHFPAMAVRPIDQFGRHHDLGWHRLALEALQETGRTAK